LFHTKSFLFSSAINKREKPSPVVAVDCSRFQPGASGQSLVEFGGWANFEKLHVNAVECEGGKRVAELVGGGLFGCGRSFVVEGCEEVVD
jgi:hypothetical protein